MPYDLRTSILSDIKAELKSHNNMIGITEIKSNTLTSNRIENRVARFTDDTAQAYIRWSTGSLQEFKFIVETVLLSNYAGYMVAEDTEAINTLTILKQGDIEQFGMHMCSHCGNLFKSLDEKTVHERIHYFM